MYCDTKINVIERRQQSVCETCNAGNLGINKKERKQSAKGMKKNLKDKFLNQLMKSAQIR